MKPFAIHKKYIQRKTLKYHNYAMNQPDTSLLLSYDTHVLDSTVKQVVKWNARNVKFYRTDKVTPSVN